MFRRVLVANRGEIARRVIKTLNRMGIQSVAIFSEADRDAGYLKEAHDAICIGGPLAKESYLCEDAILEAALQTDCEALHPGFGFLSENARFATRCAQQKLAFIGPLPHHIDLMGDKAKAIETMRMLKVPTLTGSDGVVATFEQAHQLALSMGFPVLLKARAGGGGKGMRLVEQASQLKDAFFEARMEAQSAFGDQELYLEKFIRNARHIEFQILGDAYGNVVVLGERECSVQRKNQKLLEEGPANGFSAQQRQTMCATIAKAMKQIGYQSAGTLEFLLDGDHNLYFMEMNTRIQVEHPVTELLYGVDLIEWQVRIAAQEKLNLKQEDLQPRGAAIECRINAEDPILNFKPTPGLIEYYQEPAQAIGGPVRIDTHITKGFRVSPYYDSLLAKVIVHAGSRPEALRLMRDTLGALKIAGVTTTIPFHKAILSHPEFVEGRYDCSFIAKHFEELLVMSTKE